MSYSVLEPKQTGAGLGTAGESRGSGIFRGNPVWLISLFILVGFSISVGVSLLAGSSPYGVLIAAGIPIIVLMVQAAPEALASARELAQNWT